MPGHRGIQSKVQKRSPSRSTSQRRSFIQSAKSMKIVNPDTDRAIGWPMVLNPAKTDSDSRRTDFAKGIFVAIRAVGFKSGLWGIRTKRVGILSNR